MPITMEKLKQLVDACEYHYYLDPNRPTLLFGVRGVNGQYQCLVKLDLEGRFVQLRTVSYHYAPSTAPHLQKFLELLGHLNFQMRFVKFGWDPSDGEIVVYGDAWIDDGTLTVGQMRTMINNFLSVLDLNFARIKKVLETGTDPSEEGSGVTEL